MKKAVAGIATVAVAAIAATAMAAGGVSSASPTQTRPTTLVLIDKVSDISFSATPKPGVGFTSAADIHDLSDRKIGSAAGMCAVTSLDEATQLSNSFCSSMWNLPDGEIAMTLDFPFTVGPPPAGSVTPKADLEQYDGVVTGGTGKYRNVRGQVHFEHTGDAPSGFYQFKVTFTLTY